MPLACSQACENNKAPILAIIKPLFAELKQVLEVGSGTGQHAVYFAEQMPELQWQPSDRKAYLSDLRERCKLSQLANLAEPIAFDVSQHWLLEAVDGVFSANTLHIMSADEVEDFFAGVGEILKPAGLLCVYGPFNYGGSYTSESNRQFDQWLKQRDPLSGIRDSEWVKELAANQGLSLQADHSMPANNRLIVWRKSA